MPLICCQGRSTSNSESVSAVASLVSERGDCEVRSDTDDGRTSFYKANHHRTVEIPNAIQSAVSNQLLVHCNFPSNAKEFP